jgi:hypothetical protein
MVAFCVPESLGCQQVLRIKPTRRQFYAMITAHKREIIAYKTETLPTLQEHWEISQIAG